MANEQLAQLYSNVGLADWKMKPMINNFDTLSEPKSKVDSKSSQEDMPEVRNCQGQGHLTDPQQPATS